MFDLLRARDVPDAHIPNAVAAFLLLRQKDSSSWASLLQRVRVTYRRMKTLEFADNKFD